MPVNYNAPLQGDDFRRNAKRWNPYRFGFHSPGTALNGTLNGGSIAALLLLLYMLTAVVRAQCAKITM